MEAKEKMEDKIQNQGGSHLVPIATSLPLPSIPYNKEELTEIIEEIPIPSGISAQITSKLEHIEEQVLAIRRYQAKKDPEHFYQDMKTAILDIQNDVNALYELTKIYHASLPNTLKQVILQWIASLKAELAKRPEMPANDRVELALKTKQLYVEQSFICRQPDSQATLMEHLQKLKNLVLASNPTAPRCYISYAWASKENQAEEYWVQPFLSILYDHLTQAGIRVVMDIRDNKPGDSIYRFMEQYRDGNYIILVGTESLLQKHQGVAAHAVQTELSIINSRFEQDHKQFGQSRIYPMLISGTPQSAYPEIYDKYRTVRDAREPGYLSTLKKFIDWIYEARIKRVEVPYAALWNDFLAQHQRLSREAIEQELQFQYHRQRLDTLRQDIQYQSLLAKSTLANEEAQTNTLFFSHSTASTNTQTPKTSNSVIVPQNFL